MVGQAQVLPGSRSGSTFMIRGLCLPCYDPSLPPLSAHALKRLDQTVGQLLAGHLPANADPRLAKVTVRQLLTMTSGLAGDDGSLGGDPDLLPRLLQSRDWVRHILGRRLVT